MGRRRAGGLRRLAAASADDVSPVTTEEYAAGKDLAPRPAHSALSLAKIRATGFEPRDVLEDLEAYLST